MPGRVMSNESKVQALIETAKAAPAVAGAAASTLTLNEWVAIATGVYIAIQAAYLLRKWWREERGQGGWLGEEEGT
ncbi:hypothetical protein CSE6_019_33900 [Comamonas sp. E6]|nr:hypothetical protein CSE6_019_33900 [Comamonas sp. E6]